MRDYKAQGDSNKYTTQNKNLVTYANDGECIERKQQTRAHRARTNYNKGKVAKKVVVYYSNINAYPLLLDGVKSSLLCNSKLSITGCIFTILDNFP